MGWLCHSPLNKIKDKFCKSCIKQHWTAQHNFHIDEELHVPQMFYQLYYIPNREKYNKLCKVCPVMLPLVSGVVASLPQSYISPQYLKLQMLWKWLLQQSKLIQYNQHSHPDLHICLYLEALLRPKYLSLTAFHSYIFGYSFIRSTLPKPGSSLSLHHSFLCPGTPCHPNGKAKPTEYSTLYKYFQCFKTS
jgi:hypothetical protein